MLDPLQLELHVVLNRLAWILGQNLCLMEKQQTLLTINPFPKPQDCNLNIIHWPHVNLGWRRHKNLDDSNVLKNSLRGKTGMTSISIILSF